MRDCGPTIFASVRNDEGVDDIVDLILSSFRISGANRQSQEKEKAI
jgi:urease accessory protein